MTARLVALALLAPAVAAAQPDRSTDQVTHYYGYTLAADAVGLATLVAGGFAEGENGRDTELSNALFTAGVISISFASPVIHAARGHWARGGASFLIREGSAALGMTAAVMMNAGCDGFLCGLDYIGYGMLAGFAIASVVDATMLTEERRVPPAPTWAPVVAASRGGGQIGLAATF